MADEVAITRPVSEAPRVSSISKGSLVDLPEYTTKWFVPDWATDKQANNRMEWIDIAWELFFDEFDRSDSQHEKRDRRFQDFAQTTQATDPAVRPWPVRKYQVFARTSVNDDTIALPYRDFYPFGPKDANGVIQWGQYMHLYGLNTRIYGTNHATATPNNRGPEGRSPMYWFDVPDVPHFTTLPSVVQSGAGYTLAFEAAAGNNIQRLVLDSGGSRQAEQVRVCSRWEVRLDMRGSESYVIEDDRSYQKWKHDHDGEDVNKLIMDDSYSVTLVTDSAKQAITNAVAKVGASTGDDFIARLDVRIYDQGWRGDSPSATGYFTIRKPLQISIDRVDYTTYADQGLLHIYLTHRGLSSGETGDILRQGMNPYPDEIELQRLVNSEATTPAQAAAASGWTTVTTLTDMAGLTDDKGRPVGGLVDNVGDAKSERGKRSWYRVVSRVSIGNGWTWNGTPFFLAELFEAEPTAEDDHVEVKSVEPNDAGSLKVALGWSSQDDSTGTEVSWSEYGDAWRSTQQPTTFNVEWAGETVTPPSGSTFDRETELVIRGLEEGVKYYVKARRYLTNDQGTTFGDYASAPASQFPAIPVSSPTTVLMNLDRYAIKGAAFEVSWTYDGESEQKKWIVYKYSDTYTQIQNATGNPAIQRWYTRSGSGTASDPYVYTLTTDTTPQQGVTYYSRDRVIAANGDDSVGATTITPKEGETSLSLSVAVSTGSEYTESSIGTIQIVSKPVCSLPVLPTFTANPLIVPVTSDSNDVTLTIRVISDGYFFKAPDKDRTQVPGEVVFTQYVDKPNWVASNGAYVHTVTLPNMTTLYDGGQYTVLATVKNETTGLVSDEVQSRFAVDLAHKAVPPSKQSTVLVPPGSFSVNITVIPSDGTSESDVCDVYRSTPDGYYLISEGRKFGSVITDRFAPFSKNLPLEYRLVTRTTDGDMDWVDIPYKLYGNFIRFDWGEHKHLDVPFNLEVDDKHQKDFERRKHLDGNTPGFWNPAVTRDSSVKTKIVKFGDPDELRLINDLAQFAGPVFTRTPEGSAFAANVNVDSRSWSYDKLIASVSFSAQEITLVDDFKPNPRDIEEPADPDQPTVDDSMYSKIQSPTGNPAAQGWYVKLLGVYLLTEDTTVQTGKDYYEKIY